MTGRTVVDAIAALAARVVAPFGLDDTPDPGAVQAPTPVPSRVRVIPPAMADLMPNPVPIVGSDRATRTAPVAARRGNRSGPSIPEAGVAYDLGLRQDTPDDEDGEVDDA